MKTSPGNYHSINTIDSIVRRTDDNPITSKRRFSLHSPLCVAGTEFFPHICCAMSSQRHCSRATVRTQRIAMHLLPVGDQSHASGRIASEPLSSHTPDKPQQLGKSASRITKRKILISRSIGFLSLGRATKRQGTGDSPQSSRVCTNSYCSDCVYLPFFFFTTTFAQLFLNPSDQ
jgi:hypothetical protein